MIDKDPGNLAPPGSSSIVDIFLGPMVIGIMVEQFLLGVICSQAIAYFHYHFSSDGTFCRSIATCLIISTVLSNFLDCASLYRCLVWDYSDREKFDYPGWIVWTEPSLTAWIAFIAHVFYIFRCWVVTRSLAICTFLGVVALNSLVSGITVTVFDFSAGRMSNLASVLVPATVWLISTSVCDLGIATVLAVYLQRKESVLRSNNVMISRLRRTTIETGSLTAICALANLAIFATMPEKGYGWLIQYSISHTYTISVLYTLLGRQDLRNILVEGSGTFVTEFQSSFLAAGVLSVSSLDNCPTGDAPRLRNKTHNSVTHGDRRSGVEHSRGENNV